MGSKDRNKFDEDLFEDLDDEQMHDLVLEAQKEISAKEQQRKSSSKAKRPFPKWVFWLIAMAMVFNAIALIPQTFSIPAIDFLITSAKLSTQDDIKEYKKAVVVIATEDSRGTGFSISSDGTILTNDHVIDGKETVTVSFPNDGLFTAEVVMTDPSIDLAVLETKGENLPYLHLAERTKFVSNEPIQVIGNPLQFQGIANEGTIIDYIKLENWEKEVMMVKAPIYRGNSGSPIINQNGQVIGIVFATLDHEEYGKVGLFVPIDYFNESNH
ncbi:serine protease [Pueribacillus theae]|uniref:Serine protease n=1 Tax=Pueribacillus theae TaxID=2171751 RepID=A0A2U1JX61_9BACI|nr:serine protease [Pueribacillus theae]PWA09712.1 serine protease [Pueribacillus theae]